MDNQQINNSIVAAWQAANATIWCERLAGRFSPDWCRSYSRRMYVCQGCPRAPHDRMPATPKPIKKGRGRRMKDWPREQLESLPPEVLEKTLPVTVQLLNMARTAANKTVTGDHHEATNLRRNPPRFSHGV